MTLCAELQRRSENGSERSDRQAEADWTLTDGLVFRQSAKNAADAVRLEYLISFTFAAWIKPDSLDGAILSLGEDYFEGQGHFLYLIDGKVRLHMTRRFADIGLRMETVNPVRAGEWQHVLVTYDGKRRGKGVRIYVNGVSQKTKILFDELETPLSIDKKIPFRIGEGGGRKFSGAIEDVRIYKTALSAEQAAMIPVKKSIGEIAAIPAERRSKAESDKLAACVLEKYAPEDVRSAREELTSLRRERESFYASIPTVMVMADSATPRDTFLLKRGVYDNPGEKVTAGVPSILPAPRAEWPANRLGLARWLVDRSNPLTARVTVNRFWQMYFGVGIVKTVNDFGSQGEWPVHPELLDWLAVEFMDSGWNVKALQKTIVMSATYRQSSKITPELARRIRKTGCWRGGRGYASVRRRFAIRRWRCRAYWWRRSAGRR